MICHKHKCIFIHIPRTAGTSIEQSIRPDWTNKNFPHMMPKKKHIFASTAKKIYRDYWDDYFKFSFVRNPWDRMVSMTKYGRYYGCEIKNDKLDISGYQKKFKKAEIDPRSKSKGEKFEAIGGAVYLNILNEELDFIGLFENLHEDYSKVCSAINCKCELSHKEPRFGPRLRVNNNKIKHYTEYYDDKTRRIVAKRYAKDIKQFGYKFGE